MNESATVAPRPDSFTPSETSSPGGPTPMRKAFGSVLGRPAGAFLACAVLLGLGAAQATDPPQRPAAPLSVRQGDRISVPDGSPLRSRIVVAAVATDTGAHALVLPATVEADPLRTVAIVAPTTGRLTALKVRLGDTVHRGQVLATIVSSDLAQAVADGQKSRDALALAERALARARAVNAAGSNATKDVEAAESEVAQQSAERVRSEARLAALGATDNARTLALTAPFDGVVTALNVGAGALLNDPTAALMTVTNVDRVWVAIQVPENLTGLVGRGETASVSLAAWPGRVFAGRVETVVPALDADTRRGSARIAFANADHALRPNMYATATLALRQAAAPQVPASALLMNNDRVSVFVETAPWTFERRYVEIGREDVDRVRIASGLAAGERVVVRGGVLLND